MKAPDVIIIGAGAAGLMCAIEAGKRGRKVWLIDHAKKTAEKNQNLWWRALQLHQPAHPPRIFSVQQSAFLQISPKPIHTTRLHFAG